MADRHRSANRPVGAVSFDLFGTLVDVDRPAAPADAVATALRDRGVAVPPDWRDRYRTPQVTAEPGAEVSLYEHVRDALRPTEGSPDRDVPGRETVEAAVDDAFDPAVETRPDAARVVREVGEERPVAILSNSAVPGLVERAIERSRLAPGDFDAIVASVDCGWRKPDTRSFEVVAAALDVAVDGLLHVGDDPATDGGITDAGGTFVFVDDVELARVPGIVEART